MPRDEVTVGGAETHIWGVPGSPTPLGGLAVRFTAKERILLHLLDYVTRAEALDVPPDMTQEGVSKAAGIDLRHIAQYVRPLVSAGQVRERLAHVHGIRQRRKVYDLTDGGRVTATRLRDRVREARVQVRVGTTIREMAMGEAVKLAGGKPRLTDLVRLAVRESVVNLEQLAAPESRRWVEMLDEAPCVEQFVGREKQLRLLTTTEGPPVLVVRGVAGIGKTMLAAKACDLLRGTRNLFWHRIRPWDTHRSLLVDLGSFLAGQGRPGLRAVLERPGEVVSLEIIRAELAGTGSFLVFDDAHEASDDARAFLRLLKEALAGAKEVRALVLTRETLAFYDRRDVVLQPSVAEIDLPGLSPEEVSTLGGEPGVGRRFGGHPLLVQLALSTAGEVQGTGDVHRFLEEEVYARLDVGERRAMKLASLYRVPVHREALLPGSTSPDVVGALVRRALIRPVGEDTFEVHDSVREFFGRILAGTERQELVSLGFRNLRSLADEAAVDNDWVGAAGALSNAVFLAASNADRLPILESLGDARRHLGDLKGAETTYREAMQIGAEDAEAVARLHRKIADEYLSRTEVQIAESEAEAGLQSLGDVDSVERGRLHLILSVVPAYRMEWGLALEHVEVALPILRVFRDQAGEARALLERASFVNSSLPSPDWGAIREVLGEAQQMAEAGGDPKVLAMVYNGWVTHFKESTSRDEDEVLRYLAKSEELAEEAGDVGMRADVLEQRGWYLVSRGRFDEGEADLSEIIELAPRIHAPRLAGGARAGLANSKRLQGRWEEAAADFTAVAEEFRAYQLPQPEANHLWMAAVCALVSGEIERYRRLSPLLNEPERSKFVDPVALALVHAADLLLLGDREGSLAAFKRPPDDITMRWRWEFDFGVVLMALGEEESANEHLARGREVAERFAPRAWLRVMDEEERRLVEVLKRMYRGALPDKQNRGVPPADT